MLLLRSLLILLSISFLISACSGNRPSISAEEARQLSVEFETLKFIPPKKDASSVLDILETVKRDPDVKLTYAENAVSEFNLKKVLESDASDLDYSDLYRKGMAFEFIGDYPKAIATMEKALEIRSDGERKHLRNIYGGLTIANILIGDLNSAKKYLDLKKRLAINAYQRSNDYSKSALLSLYQGDLVNAEKNLSESKWSLSQVQKSQLSSHHWGEYEWIFAEYLSAMGDFERAEEYFLSAIEDFEGNQWGNYGYIPYIQTRWADIKNDLGQSIEAEVIGRKALIKLVKTQGKDSPLTAIALSTIARSLLEQGKVSYANGVALRAKEILLRSGVKETSFLLFRINAMLSAISTVNQKWSETIDLKNVIQDFYSTTTGVKKPMQLPDSVEVYLNLAIALLKKGMLADASEALNDIEPVTRNIYGDTSYAMSEVRLIKNILRALAPDESFAIDNVRADVKHLMDAINNVVGYNGFNVRRKRLEAIGEYFTELALSNPSLIDVAFTLSDLTKSSNVADSLIKSQVRNNRAQSREVGPIRKLQNLERRITSLKMALANHQLPLDSFDITKTALEARIYDLEAKALQEKEKINSSAVNDPQINEISITKLASTLKDNEVLIKYSIGQDKSYIWLIQPSGKTILKDLSLKRRDFSRMVRKLRASLDPERVRKLSDIPAYDLSEANHLYQLLFTPIENHIEVGKTIIVIADTPLASLPLSVLPTRLATNTTNDPNILFEEYLNVDWLAQRNPIMYLPSASSLIELRKNNNILVGNKKLFALGDPFFNKDQADKYAKNTDTQNSIRGDSAQLRNIPQLSKWRSAHLEMLPRLPDTRTEVLGVAKSIGGIEQNNVLLGSLANESNVKKSDLKQYQFIHFATHGLVSGDLDGLNETALALSSPEVTGEKTQDGLLTSAEVMELNLNAKLVILSACNTASAEGSNEAFSGLGSAFFYAGARAVLLSNWPVHSGATKELMINMFQNQNTRTGVTEAQALQKAAIYLAKGAGAQDAEGKTIFFYAHPIFWAPFTIVGDGGY